MGDGRIKVLFLITGLNIGGAERVVMSLSKFLDPARYSVSVVSLTSKSCILDQYQGLSCEVLTVNMERGPFGFIAGIFHLAAIVRRIGPDIIHAHMFHAMVAGLACRVIAFRAKLVFTSHSFSGFRFMRGFMIRATRALRSADVVFSKSQHPELNAKHTYVIANGVPIAELDHSVLTRRERPFVFLFVGRLELPKNPTALVEAFSAMREKHCELWVVGDGALRCAVESLSKSLGVSDRVRILGVRSDVPDLLKRADCLVLTSLWEGLPMVVLEAGAASLPVISTGVGAIPEVLEGRCGYISSIDKFSLAMDHVMKNYMEAQSRGAALYKKVSSDYSIAGMVERHQQLYSLLMAR